jgi:hypothetical protein
MYVVYVKCTEHKKLWWNVRVVWYIKTVDCSFVYCIGRMELLVSVFEDETTMFGNLRGRTCLFY